MAISPDATVWRGALVSVGVVSAIPLVCLVFVARGKWAGGTSSRLVSLAIGALLANALFELVPDAIVLTASRWLVLAAFVAGFAFFAAIERLLGAHIGGLGIEAMAGVEPYVPLTLVGVTLHNAIDGAIIAAGYAAGTTLGVATTIAVVMHEIPHEIGDFGVFVRGGVAPKRAVVLNLVSAVAAVAGAVGTLLLRIAPGRPLGIVLAVAAGNLVYVAVMDLIPAVHRDTDPAGRGRAALIALAGAAAVLVPEVVAR